MKPTKQPTFLKYLVTKRTVSFITIVIALMLLTFGMPTNIGGFHMERVWGADANLFAKIVGGGILFAVVVLLTFHAAIEWVKVTDYKGRGNWEKWSNFMKKPR